MAQIVVDGTLQEATAGERLIDAINSAGAHLPQVCYHPQLGPIQTSDTCIVEIDGELVRACATLVAPCMNVFTARENARAARTEVF